jgi:hypothetical protein
VLDDVEAGKRESAFREHPEEHGDHQRADRQTSEREVHGQRVLEEEE